MPEDGGPLERVADPFRAMPRALEGLRATLRADLRHARGRPQLDRILRVGMLDQGPLRAERRLHGVGIGGDLDRRRLQVALEGEGRGAHLAVAEQQRARFAQIPGQAAETGPEIPEAADEALWNAVHPPNGSRPGGSSSSSRTS